jgi:hypothetical protein
VADPGGVRDEPPFGLHRTLRSTDDRLNGTPLSGYRTKKSAAMAQKKIGSKIDRVRLVVFLKNDRKWAWFPQVGVA